PRWPTCLAGCPPSRSGRGHDRACEVCDGSCEIPLPGWSTCLAGCPPSWSGRRHDRSCQVCDGFCEVADGCSDVREGYCRGGWLMTARLSPARGMLTVSPTAADCYRTISDAVVAASHGDVISILPGTYQESVVLDREVTLSAAGAHGEVRIESQTEPAIRLAAETATVSGVLVRHSGPQTAAIDVPAGLLRLEECVVAADSAAALYVHGTAEIAARACVLSNSGGAGVVAAERAGGLLEGCTVRDVGSSAVVIRGDADPRLVDCTLVDAGGSGVLAADRGHGSVQDCRIVRAGNPAVAVEGEST